MKKLYALIFMLAVSTVSPLFTAGQASASGIDWQAGNIMSDAVFTNKTSMTTAQIQDFLNSKVPVCDTNGQQNSEFGGPDINGDGRVQRWEWGQANYNQTTFPCLKDYTVTDGRKAAQVIYDVAQKYSINPQVLIVLLQKEQGLVADTWPLNIQYRSATGYGCPDTAPCDTQYYGLVNQLDWAAKMFRSILNDSPYWYTPYELGNNYIQYNPVASCGGSTVDIQNRTTQALYNYTPYQPSQAAIDAGWGTVNCGAYGNRNFYLYFTSWFGSTRGGELFSYDLEMATPITVSPVSPRAGDSITVSFDIRNSSSNTINYGGNLAQCRIALTTNCDSAMSAGGSIAAGATRSFSYTIKPSRAGQMVIKPVFLSSAGVWYRFSPSTGGNLSELAIKVPQLRATGPLGYNIKHPNVGETISFSVPLTNNGLEPLTISTSLIQCRIDGITNCDTPPGGSDTIQPGQTRTYRYSIPVTTSGTYTLAAYYRYDDRWFKYIYLDSPTDVYTTDITTNGTFSPSDTTPITGQPFSVDYSLQNNSTQDVALDTTIIQCRFNIAENCDANFTAPTVLTQGASIASSNTFKSTEAGSYRFVPYYRIGGEYHIPRTSSPLAVAVNNYTADMRVTSFNVPTPPIGGEYDITYTVRNYGAETAYYTNGVLQCRHNTTTNCDPAAYGQIEIAPGASRTFTDRVSSSTVSGTYRLIPYYSQNGTWHQYKSADSTVFAPRVTTVAYVAPSLSVDGGTVVLGNAAPQAGSVQTVQYTVTNNSASTISISKWVTQCRVNGINCDAPIGYGPGFSLAPGASTTLTSIHTVTTPGTYTLVPYFTYNNTWHKYSNNPVRTFTAIN